MISQPQEWSGVQRCRSSAVNAERVQTMSNECMTPWLVLKQPLLVSSSQVHWDLLLSPRPLRNSPRLFSSEELNRWWRLREGVEEPTLQSDGLALSPGSTTCYDNYDPVHGFVHISKVVHDHGQCFVNDMLLLAVAIKSGVPLIC